MSEFEAFELEAYPAPVFSDVSYPQRPLCVSIAGKYIQLSKHHMPFRTIDEYVVILCTDGEGWIILDSAATQSVHAGELLFLPKDTAQSYGCAPNGYWSLLWFHCSGDGAKFFHERFCAQLQKSNRKRLAVRATSSMHFYFNSIIATLKHASSIVDLLQAEATAYQFFCALVSDTNFTNLRNPNEQLVHTVMHWMESTVQYNINLDELSAQFGVSKYHLIRLFKRYADTTPMDYFHQVKLKKSCGLLTRDSRSVAEVSDLLCYSSPYHFSRAFKLYFGISPSQFQKKIAGREQ